MLQLLPLPWLLDSHKQPWLSAQVDGFSFLLIWIFYLYLHRDFYNRKQKIIFTPPFAFLIIGLGVFASWFLSNASTDRHIAIALYAMFAFMAWDLGRHANAPNIADKTWSTAEKLCIGIVITCLVSLGIQLLQFLSLSESSIFSAWIKSAIQASQPYGNIGQPNLLATTQIWGLVALGYLHNEKRIGSFMAMFAGLLIILGIAMTQSRTALISLFALSVYSLLFKPLRGLGILTALIFVITFGLILLLPDISQWVTSNFGGHTAVITKSIENFSSGSIRIEIWKELFNSALSHPFWGTGLDTTSLRFLDVYPIEALPDYRKLFVFSHNIVVDSMLWIGLIPTLIIFFLLTLWAIRYLTTPHHKKELILLGFSVPFAVHSLLEFPFAHGHMLLVWAVSLGLWSSTRSIEPQPALNALPTKSWGLLTPILAVLVGAFGVAATVDYFKIRHAFMAIDFERRFIVLPHEHELNPNLLVLKDWGHWLQLNRNQAADGCAAASGLSDRHLERVLHLYPTASTLSRVAYCLELRQQPERAHYWRERICAVAPAQACLQLKGQSYPVASPEQRSPLVRRLQPD